MNPFASPLAALQARLAAVIPAITAKAGSIVLQHTAQAFRDQGFTDAALAPWVPRAVKDEKDDAGRAILVKTGRLRRSIRIVSKTNDTITIGTDVPYAQVHNDGFSGSITVPSHSRTIKTVKKIGCITSVKQHTRTMTMPQRKFLGASIVQTENIKKMITREIDTCFKNIT